MLKLSYVSEVALLNLGYCVLRNCFKNWSGVKIKLQGEGQWGIQKYYLHCNR